MRCGSAINIFYQSATLLMNRAWSSIFFLLCALTVTSMLHAATPMDKRSEEWLCGLLLALNLGFCNPLEIWSHQLSIRCRLLAQTLYFAIQHCNLGDLSTWMKQNTSVLKKIIDLDFFWFFLSKTGLFWTQKYSCLDLIWGEVPQITHTMHYFQLCGAFCLPCVRHFCSILVGSLLFSNSLNVEITVWQHEYFVVNIWCWCLLDVFELQISGLHGVPWMSEYSTVT